MNRFPLWKNLLLLLTVVVGFVYALPNIYPPDPAVQITPVSARVSIDEATLKSARARLDELNIGYFGEQLSERGLLFRIRSKEEQLKAQREIANALGDDFIVAVNLVPTTPEWLQSIGASPMNLGLDLAGGVHFLLEVDTQKVIDDSIDDAEGFLKKAVRENNLRGVSVRAAAGKMVISARTQEQRDAIVDIINKNLSELELQETKEEDRFSIVARLSEVALKQKEDNAVQQNLVTLRKRVNEIGVSEPLVQRQGRNRIVVQLAGIQDSALAKKILGKTANLEFRLEATAEASLAEKERFDFRSEQDQRMFGGADLERKVLVFGRSVLGASPSFDQQSNTPEVAIQLDSQGASDINRGTRHNIGRRMGVLFIEYRPETRSSVDENGNEVTKTVQVAEKKIISLATIRGALGKNFVITGLESPEEASELALYLRAGALAAPMTYVEERTIGPSLGADNIKMGIKSAQVGFFLVVICMLIIYRVFGLAANLALVVNVFFIIAIMSTFHATLTLPGIAGIVLTLGMAVDANVLIFSRIREELANGTPIQSAISAGFDRAFTTILDSNLTTLIVALILFGIGTGPVKGFAVTLSIGILTSMFTAILISRAIINLTHGYRHVKKLWI